MDATKSNFKVLLFPWLAHGHIFPFLELAKKLSKKSFDIYFCSTPINLDSIRKSLNTNLSHTFSIRLVELHLPSPPELPPQYHTTKNIPPNLMPTLMQTFQRSSSAFAEILGDIKPDLLIYDVFQPWAAKSARSQGIPTVHFATSGAMVYSFACHLYTHKNYASYPFPEIYLRDYEKKELQSHGASIKVEDCGEGFVFGIFDLSCDIVLIKSCREIEGKYIDYFSELCHKNIVPVGPLITRNKEENSPEILRWLSKKNPCSTLYIAFGSENYLSREQMEEIAKGLEISQVNFIWVARFPIGSSFGIKDVLPEGFLDRVKERGLVETTWAPQADILVHSSVGGFMSHCGWSSIVESICFGVPIVAVPIKLDQPMNSRLVVDAGVGVEVTRDEKGRFDGKGVAKAINEVILENTGGGFRSKTRELRDKIKLEEEQGFDEVVEKLSSICMKKI